MSKQYWPLILGGVIPAVCLGLFSVFQKFSTRAGLGPGFFLVVVGVMVALTGTGVMLYTGERSLTLRGGLFAGACGLVWGVGFGLISYTLIHYRTPISKLSPLFNSNTLVAVLLSLIIFAEWQEVSLPRVAVATVFILIGGLLISTS